MEVAPREYTKSQNQPQLWKVNPTRIVKRGACVIQAAWHPCFLEELAKECKAFEKFFLKISANPLS